MVNAESSAQLGHSDNSAADRQVVPGFVGRAAERAVLDAAWERARAGAATIVAVHGPAGFGKTTLVGDFLRRATPPTVLRAVGDPDETLLPFGVLDQLFHPGSIAAEPPAALAAAGRGEPTDPLVLGSAVLHALSSWRAAGDPADDAAGGTGGGLVVVVDDVQWADVPSVRALVFALRRLRFERVLAVLVCRDDSLNQLPAGLQRLLRDVATSVRVDGFGAAEISALAGARRATALSRLAVSRLVTSSGGSPLHALALLDELTPEQIEGDPSKPLPASRAFADLIAGRLESCGGDGRALVRASAVIGDGHSLRHLAQLAELDDPLAAMDQAAAAGLLQTPIMDGAVRLAHPLTRSAAYHAIPLPMRAGLHRRAAELLAATDAGASLRHRVAATSGLDAELAAEVGARAAADVARGAWPSAAEGFRVAAELCGPNHPEFPGYTLRMIECLALSGDVGATRAAVSRIESYEPSALRDYCLGRLHALTGELPQAFELLTSAWARQETREAPGATEPVPANPELAARIAGESARVAVMTGRGQDAMGWAQRALGLAAPDDAARGDAMAVMLLAFGILGRASEGLTLVAGLPEEITEPTPAELDGIVGRGMLSLWNDDLPQAHSDLGLAVAVTRRNGPVHLNLYVSTFLADTAYRMGEWDLAIAEAETGAALARDLDNAWTLPMLHAMASMPHAARGNFDVAAAHADAALAAAADVGDIPSYLWAVIAGARLAHSRRDMPGVVAALEPLTAITHLDGVREPGVQAWQSLYASALVATGRLDQAQAVLEDAASFAASRRHLVEQLALGRTRAQLAQARGDLDGALAVMAHASELYESISGRPFETAQFDLAHGALLRRAAKRTAAAAALRRAEAAFTQLGAAPWTETARAELRRCGIGTQGTRPRSTSQLTPHEQMIAGLVAQGLTNRRIAAELGVTPKTVEYHLSNVYAKLGLRSRVQLATLYPTLLSSGD